MLTEAIDLLGNDIALAHAKDILAKANQAAGQRRARGPASTSTTAGRAAPATSRRTWSVSCRWRDRAAARPGRARRGNRAARRSLLQLRQSSRWLAAIARADWWRLRHGYRHPSTGPAVLVSRNAGRGIRLLGNRSGLSVFGKQGTLYVMDYETLLLASPTDDPTAERRCLSRPRNDLPLGEVARADESDGELNSLRRRSLYDIRHSGWRWAFSHSSLSSMPRPGLPLKWRCPSLITYGSSSSSPWVGMWAWECSRR